MRIVPLVVASCLLAGVASHRGDANLPSPSRAIAEVNQRATTPLPARARDLPVLFIVGDSTVHNAAPGLLGWGDVLGRYFDTNRIIVENHAKPGRSTRTFRTQGWWAMILAAARPGDFVLIQMGHNEPSPITDTTRARGTLPGLGEAKTNIYNPVRHMRETVHSYGWYLRKYIDEARKKKLTLILCSPAPRLPATQGTNTVAEKTPYAGWTEEVARTEKVFFIDLNRHVLDRYSGLTATEIRERYFTPRDTVHFSAAGSELNAACVMEGLVELKDCQLNKYVVAPGQ